MKEAVISLLKARFKAFEDIVADSSDELLQARLDVERDKTLVEHFWCVIGARESYTRGIETGEWPGFTSSLTEFDQKSILEKLKASSEAFENTVKSVADWSSEQERLLLELHEHEVMHEGQIIRHVFGQERELPDSCRWA